MCDAYNLYLFAKQLEVDYNKNINDPNYGLLEA
jgi:hypothetical protein